MTQLSTIKKSGEIPIRAECHACGKLFAPRQLFEYEDHFFCAECMEDQDLFRCGDCGRWKKNDEMYTTANEDTICESCYCDNYFTCPDCEKIHHEDNSISYANSYLCMRCYERNYFTCDACSEVYHNDDCYSSDDGCYCESCFNERRCECTSCGDECSRDDMEDIRGIGPVCPSCRPSTEVHNYSYKPTPEFHGEGKFFLGIELEIHCDNICESLNTFNETDLERLYCKEDGSVHHGFEVVSHPMTIEEHRAFDWPAFCERMADSGAHGNKPGHGIHIHISKMYLSELQRLKLYWFLCHHFKQVVKLTRRSACYFEGRSVDRIIRDIKRTREYEGGRNEMLNWGPKDTVEFRLPLSTLRGETLLALLELCDAAVKFAQTDVGFMALRDCWYDFMTWCAEHGYNCLVGYYWSMELGDELDER